MKIGKAISIELRDGQRLSLSLKETKELYAKLGKMLADASSGSRRRTGREEEKTGRKKRRIAGRKSKTASTKSSSPSSSSRTIVSLSDGKRQEVLAHINKEISETPRTLTNLLKGVSYSASQLPAIRSIIESQQSIKAKTKGKRTLYLKKRTAPRATTTAAAKSKTTAPPDAESKATTTAAA